MINRHVSVASAGQPKFIFFFFPMVKQCHHVYFPSGTCRVLSLVLLTLFYCWEVEDWNGDGILFFMIRKKRSYITWENGLENRVVGMDVSFDFMFFVYVDIVADKIMTCC